MVKRSFSWLTLQQIARGIVGMLTAGLIARSLGEKALGLLDSSFAIINLTAGFAGLGLQRVVTRELCGESASQSAVKGTSFLLGGIASFIGIVVVNLLSKDAPTTERLVILSACLLLVTQPLNFLLTSIFEAEGRLDIVAKVSFVGLTISTLIRIWAVHRGWAIYWQAVAYGLDMAITCALGWAIISRRYPRWTTNWRIDRRMANSLLRESLPLLLASLAAFVYISIDILMLKWISGYQETGFYSAAIRLSQVPLFIPGLLAATFTARLMQYRNQHGHFPSSDILVINRILLGIGLACLIGGWLLGPLAVRMLYGEEFARSGSILQIHVIGVFFMLVGSIRNHLLILEKRGNLVLLCDICGAISNLALNSLLIPLYGAMGASWATAISYFIAYFLINLIHPSLRKYSIDLFSILRRPSPTIP
jgi:PST family polysaccharide transporter